MYNSNNQKGKKIRENNFKTTTKTQLLPDKDNQIKGRQSLKGNSQRLSKKTNEYMERC